MACYQHITQLERRFLLSASSAPLAKLSAGTLTVKGTTAADDIVVTESSGNIVVTDNSTQLVSEAASSVKRISINGDTGGDTIDIDSSVTGVKNININDKKDNTDSDTVTIGADVKSKITLGSANDTVSAGEGDTFITAGNGNDSITAGSGGDAIATGTGDDTVSLGSGNSDAVLFRGSGTLSLGNDTNDIVASGSKADTISDTNGYNLIACGPSTTVSASSTDTVYLDGDSSSNISGGPHTVKGSKGIVAYYTRTVLYDIAIEKIVILI